MDDGLFLNYSAEGRDLIRKAYDMAEQALQGEVRSDGSPFFGHPLAVAKIVSDEIGLPPECVAAVFLHEAVRKGSADVDIRSLKLDESIYTMVDGLNKIATIKPKDTRLEAENYKKLIIQYSTDPRVTVLKLADRLEVMRSLAIFPKSDRERKVLETLMLYIPLAHQLGLYNMKREMEDIYLSYAEPEQYRLITNKLKATQKDREKLMAEFIEPLKKKLSDAGITYGRMAGWAGRQTVFDNSRRGREGEGALGYCGRELEGKFIAGNEFNYVRENASLFVDKNYMFDAIYRVEVNGKWVKVLVGIKDIEKKPTIAWMTAYACYMFLYDIENIIRRKGYDSLNGFGPDDFVECFVMIVLNMSGEDWGSYVDVSDIYDNRDVSERESIPIKVINLGHLLDKERDVLDSEVLLADEILREMQKFGKLEIVLEKYKDEMEKVSPELFAVLMNMPGFAGKAKKEH